jgi:hypothetical protein
VLSNKRLAGTIRMSLLLNNDLQNINKITILRYYKRKKIKFTLKMPSTSVTWVMGLIKNCWIIES